MRLAVLLVLLSPTVTAAPVGEGAAFQVWWDAESTVERTAQVSWEFDLPEGSRFSYPWTLSAGVETRGEPPEGGVLFRLATWIDGTRVHPDDHEGCAMDHAMSFPGGHATGTCRIHADALLPGPRHVEVVLESAMNRRPDTAGDGSGLVEGIIGAAEMTAPATTSDGRDINAAGSLPVLLAAIAVARRRGPRGNR